MSHLKYLPKPLVEDLLAGRWLPIVGAGFSRNARVPRGKKMPLWNDLGKGLADDLADYPYNGALDAASAYEHEYGRPKLIERLSDMLLLEESQPSEAHRAFCSVPFDVVCTTNFDFLLERQYAAAARGCRPVIDENQLSVGTRSPNSKEPIVTLIKVHGDVNHPNRLVVTEADYDGFLTTYPLLATYLANLLITRTAVFVGYSLDDPDFRQIWHVVSQRLGRCRRTAYAITVDAVPSDLARFERRGVKVISLPGSSGQYGTILAALFDEIREYIREKVISVSQVTEEDSLRELSLPRSASTRLCFFALPLSAQPFYRERVFPLVREAGFVPVTADEVVSPGDNILAKVDAILDRSRLVIAEAATQWTLAELRMALARDKQRRVLVVMAGGAPLPVDLRGFDVIERPDFLHEDVSRFLDQLKDWLSRQTDVMGSRIDEAVRLLELGEYRAAVISAMAALEISLAESVQVDDTPRRTSMSGLVDWAIAAKVIPRSARNSLHQWISLRNRAAHMEGNVTRSQAKAVVSGVKEILDKPQKKA